MGLKAQIFDDYFTFYKDENWAAFNGEQGNIGPKTGPFPIQMHRQAIEVVEILQMNVSTARRDDVRKAGTPEAIVASIQ